MPLSEVVSAIEGASLYPVHGRVSECAGSIVHVVGLDGVSMGDQVQIRAGGEDVVLGEIVGFHRNQTYVLPVGEIEGIHTGATVLPVGKSATIPCGDMLLGRVIDSLGRPIDGKGPLLRGHPQPLQSAAPPPLSRAPINQVLQTGVRAIDGLLTLGKGQRIGIFSGSGVGKSTLLGMIARSSSADVNVIALVGERGREVREFIEDSLGEEGLARSVVLVSTGDEGPVLRARCASAATAVAEYFRDRGKDVMLMMDSVTRVAHAHSLIAAAGGEVAVRRGVPVSVFDRLQRLLERSGTNDKGTITGLYTVLVDADDMNDPVADAVRGTLDGHLVLSRRLAGRNQFPAIDVTGSVSRLRDRVAPEDVRRSANEILRLYAVYQDNEDLIQTGLRKPGADQEVDIAVGMHAEILRFLQQDARDTSTWEHTLESLAGLDVSRRSIEKTHPVGR